MLGSAFIDGFGWFLVAFVVAVPLLTLKARAEERLMQETFGDAYVAYRKRTPQIVPFWMGRRS